MRFRVYWPVFHCCTGRMGAKEIITFPVLRWSDGPRHKPATTIRANIVQQRLHTGCTKGAFIGTNARFQRIGRQCLVTLLTSRSEFEHVVFSLWVMVIWKLRVIIQITQTLTTSIWLLLFIQPQVNQHRQPKKYHCKDK